MEKVDLVDLGTSQVWAALIFERHIRSDRVSNSGFVVGLLWVHPHCRSTDPKDTIVDR